MSSSGRGRVGFAKKKFQLPKVQYKATSRGLVGRAGVVEILSLLDSSELGQELANCLPPEESNRSTGNYKLAMLLLASLICGHDALEDIEEFDDDDLILSWFEGKLPTAKTLGNFLRAFSQEHMEALKLFLVKFGYTIREHVRKLHSEHFTFGAEVEPKDFPHFKIDETTHEQYGKKMEGCGWITKGDKSIWCYGSQTMFDELGICYSGERLSGAERGDAVIY